MEGLERIRILASEIKDKALLKIVDYLLTRQDMNEKYLNEEKSLKQMIEFIKSLAQKESKNGMAIIEDDEVYNWAIHYWDETNKNLGLNKEKNSTQNDDCDNNYVEKEKEDINKKQLEPKKNKEQIKTKKIKTWVPEGQLSLFDYENSEENIKTV